MELTYTSHTSDNLWGGWYPNTAPVNPGPYISPVYPVYPVYPTPVYPAPCPGCGACPVCGRKATPMGPGQPTITWQTINGNNTQSQQE
jgi:hypothetical protein